MSHEVIKAALDDMGNLFSAAREFALAEIASITKAVIASLEAQPAIGMFDDVAPRHMWDEYRWSLQDGPYDDDMVLAGRNLGSVSGAWDDTVRGYAEGEVKKLPHHELIFLSVHAFAEDVSESKRVPGASIWVDGIVDLVMDEIKEFATKGNLDLIGPDRGEMIRYEAEGSGIVWSALSDQDEAMDLVASYADEILDPKGNLSRLAAELVDAFITTAKNEANGDGASAILFEFETQIRELLTTRDVLRGLEHMRDKLHEALDQ